MTAHSETMRGVGEACCPHCGAGLGPTLKGLTRRQADAVDAIDTYYSVKGCAPTYTELLAALGLFSTSTAHRLVAGLKERGWVSARPGGARSLTLTPAARDELKRMRAA